MSLSAPNADRETVIPIHCGSTEEARYLLAIRPPSRGPECPG